MCSLKTGNRCVGKDGRCRQTRGINEARRKKTRQPGKPSQTVIDKFLALVRMQCADCLRNTMTGIEVCVGLDVVSSGENKRWLELFESGSSAPRTLYYIELLTPPTEVTSHPVICGIRSSWGFSPVLVQQHRGPGFHAAAASCPPDKDDNTKIDDYRTAEYIVLHAWEWSGCGHS